MITLSNTFDLVHGATAVFRSVLEATANPGRETLLPEGENPWLALAVTLLDGETGFYWDGSTELSDSIRFLTGAQPVEAQEADFLLVTNLENLARLLPLAKTGTFEEPHRSATIVTVADASPVDCRLKGPGVKPGSSFRLPGEILACMDQREALGLEYPCGIDLLFLTGSGIIAIPRLIRREAQ